MTIAAAFVSDEGVIFGADSTTTYSQSGGLTRHLNNAQKVFEVGDAGSTLGLVTWGRASLPSMSYRQLVAEVSDDLLQKPPSSVGEVALRFSDRFWHLYSSQLAAEINCFQALLALPAPTPAQQVEMNRLFRDLFVGFCIGGHVATDRRPIAYEVLFGPDLTSPLVPREIVRDTPVYWGVPSLIKRLLYAIDEDAFERIKASPHWTGNEADLIALVRPSQLRMPKNVPLRDAIDWIYSSIFLTIKGIKFSDEPPVCGGPIEVAVISADRRFRWVSHKGLDHALSDHFPRGDQLMLSTQAGTLTTISSLAASSESVCRTYHTTGEVRAEDLTRLYGDIRKSVEMPQANGGKDQDKSSNYFS